MKYVFFALTLLLALAVPSNLSAQKKELKKARSNYDLGEYYLSLDFYSQAEELGAELSLEDRKCKARCYYQLNRIIDAYNEYESLESNLTGEDIFNYASVLHQFELYDMAIEWYEKAKLQGTKNAFQINDLIGACRWATNNDTELPYTVNPCFPLATQGQSFGVQYFNNTVVYSSASDGSKNLDKFGNPFLNLYCSDLSNDTAYVGTGGVIEGSGRIFSQNLVSPYHVGAIAFTPDKQHMYFTKTVIDGDNDRIQIFVVDYNGSDWVNERPLTINSDKYDCAHPAVSPDGSTLFFVSNRPDGYGGKDIYSCEIKGPNSFGPVKNLGSTINTYGDEVYPVVNPDGKLYFSSNGHFGYGGLDIFVAEYIDGKWQNVRNMMKRFNSNFDDFGYIIDPTNPERGFLSTNRYQDNRSDVIFYWTPRVKEESDDKKEVFSFDDSLDDSIIIFDDDVEPEPAPAPAPEPEPIVVPEPEPEPEPQPVVEEVKPRLFVAVVTSTYDGSKIADAVVSLSDASTGTAIASATTDASGQVRINIAPEYINENTDYNITVSKEGFKSKSVLASLEELDNMRKEPIALTPIFNDSVLDDLSGMTIPYGVTDFDEASRTVLDKVAAYLLANPNIVVRFNGHTEAKGNRYGNLNVSQKFAEKAQAYVVAKGVDERQIIPRGYGERYLVNRCLRGRYCDKAQHAENRRIEVVVWKGSGK